MMENYVIDGIIFPNYDHFLEILCMFNHRNMQMSIKYFLETLIRFRLSLRASKA